MTTMMMMMGILMVSNAKLEMYGIETDADDYDDNHDDIDDESKDQHHDAS